MDDKAQKNLFDALRAVDTPTICNALEEARGFRTAAGFTTQHMHPTEPDAPPMVGFARTGIIRAAQPAVGSAAEKKARRVGWYEYVVSGEGPTVAVIQDLDSNPGTGAAERCPDRRVAGRDWFAFADDLNGLQWACSLEPKEPLTGQ